jgi:hypothetical protein
MIAAPTEGNPIRVYTDGFAVYNLYNDRNGFNHIVVVHDHSFGEGLCTTNHIEGFWSQLKATAQFDGGLNPSTIEEIFFCPYRFFSLIIKITHYRLKCTLMKLSGVLNTRTI